MDVDGARDYLAQGGGKKPSRKVVYNMVASGMKVARIGDTGRHLRFSAQWIDDFLIARSSTTPSSVADGAQ